MREHQVHESSGVGSSTTIITRAIIVYFIEDVWPLELMNDTELEHQWLQRHPDRYGSMDNQLFLNTLDQSGLRVLRHDNRKLTKQPDSYIIELRS